MKVCSKCSVEKGLDEFYKNKKCKLGVTTACKACWSEYTKVYRAKNKDKITERKRVYNTENKEYIREQARRYKEKNKEKITEQRQRHYVKHKDTIAEYKKEYYKENKQAFAKRREKWYDNNKDQRNSLARDKYANDRLFKVICSLRSRLNLALKGSLKSESTETLLGCTFDNARAHIEAQFTKGMSWDNHGRHGWHIDHITPCASFDLSIAEQQRQCFHYTNLQPLWAEDNISKSDKMPEFH